jgi:hypothetical protein
VPLVIGRNKQARQTLASVALGEELVIRPKASYRRPYTFADVCDLCTQITNEELTLAEIRRDPGAYKVPRKTLSD